MRASEGSPDNLTTLGKMLQLGVGIREPGGFKSHHWLGDLNLPLLLFLEPPRTVLRIVGMYSLASNPGPRNASPSMRQLCCGQIICDVCTGVRKPLTKERQGLGYPIIEPQGRSVQLGNHRDPVSSGRGESPILSCLPMETCQPPHPT